ncbi:hypothetical protein F5X96DRAFT_587297 [Biscogniauxia mediterranea]|nr:hypothetical protein F5X96DRAFT_587297 [Biscogniauxia mediterranea]
MGLATKLKEALGDYKNRRNSASTAQGSLYRDNDAIRSPTSFRADEFPRPSNDSNNHVNQERWIRSRNSTRDSEEVSPKTSKFRTESRASGLNLGQGQHHHHHHHHGHLDEKDEEQGGEDVWPRVTGLRKPNYAADPLYHQRHYKHYVKERHPAEQAKSASPSAAARAPKNNKNKKSGCSGGKSPLTKQLPPTPPEEAHAPVQTSGREVWGGTSFLRSSHSTSSSSAAAPQHRRHHHQGSSSSSSSSFFPWLAASSEEVGRRDTGTTAFSSNSGSNNSYHDAKHHHHHDYDHNPPLYTSPLSPEPRRRVLRETIPSSAVFGAGPGRAPWCASTPTPTPPIPTPIPTSTLSTTTTTHSSGDTPPTDRGSIIIVGIDKESGIRDLRDDTQHQQQYQEAMLLPPLPQLPPLPLPPLPPLPPPPTAPRRRRRGHGHVPKDSLGSISRGAALPRHRRSSSSFSSSSSLQQGGFKKNSGGGSGNIAVINEASDSGSGSALSSRISTGAVGGVGVIEQRRRRGGSSSAGIGIGGGRGEGEGEGVRARSGSGRTSTSTGTSVGLRIVHRCEACGVDNDISRYFREEAVYRMS